MDELNEFREIRRASTARSGTGRTGGRFEVALATLSAESGLSSAPTMSLPSRLERLMLDAAGLGIGVGNDQLFFRNELVSEMARGHLRCLLSIKGFFVKS